MPVPYSQYITAYTGSTLPYEETQPYSTACYHYVLLQAAKSKLMCCPWCTRKSSSKLQVQGDICAVGGAHATLCQDSVTRITFNV